MRDNPWMMRTYAGHSSAKESNALYRMNLAKGQTGLSVAFDLPTQTGYDPDHILAKGEVGKVGVPVTHLGDMRTLLEEIPLGEMNTSMTINATAMWLYALYLALAEEQGVQVSEAELNGRVAGIAAQRGVRLEQQLLRLFPADAPVGDRHAVLESGAVRCRRLAAGVDVALEHQAHDRAVAREPLG